MLHLHKLLAVLLSFAAILGLSACDWDSSFLLGLQLNLHGVNLVSGSTVQLLVSPEPAMADLPELLWSSSDASIVSVDQTGVLTGVNAGVATITVRTSDGLKSDECAVAVWGKESGFIKFACANPKYYDWRFWWVPPGQNASSDLAAAPVNIVLTKPSGSTTCGFGLMFCYTDDNNYYQIRIDRAKTIQVIKKVAGLESLIYGPFTNSNLNSGVAANTLEITRNSSQILVKVNGAAAILIADTAFSNGMVAFYAAVDITGSETLPGTAVDIRYTLTKPLKVP